MQQPDPRDTAYTEYTIKEVIPGDNDHYEIRYGARVSYQATDGVAPKVGETVRIYTGISNSDVRGLVVGGRLYSYETMAERKARHDALRARHEAATRENFPKYDRRYAALPAPFRSRIDYFRRLPNFRLQAEGQELLVCEKAARLAEECGSVEAVSEFCRLSLDRRCRKYPWLESNSEPDHVVEIICRLAYVSLTDPEHLPDVPGAAAYLAAEAYGE